MNRRTFLLSLASLGVLSAGAGGCTWMFMRQEKFGAFPEDFLMERIRRSPHYAGGEFVNIEPTKVMQDNENFLVSGIKYFTAKRERPAPSLPIPSAKFDLKSLPADGEYLVWLGHSSFFLRLGGKNLLIDPVFSPYASPVSFSIRAFEGASPYKAEDMPPIDCLVISHDHWDHLDYPTVMALKNSISKIICPLGVGANFRRWGFHPDCITECDWGEETPVGNNLIVHTVTARHFSGRTLTRNKSLWAGFVFETPKRRIFFSGDSGYGSHFGAIRKKFGPMQISMLDCGQYNEKWRNIHMNPDHTAQAAEDLQTQFLLPSHIGKFSLAYHPWDEPFIRISELSKKKNYGLVTPLIGSPVDLASIKTGLPEWWKGIA